jgi:methionine-R-sulfoxide reductase
MLFRSTRKSISRTKNGWSYCRRSSSTSCAERARSCRLLAVTLDHHNGTYVCSACGNPLYSAETKFNSGTGWPSFWQPIRKEAIHESSTSSAIFGVEISCARCGSHLGHVFNDGPPPTGLRYCMNAVALTYREASPGSAPALPRAGQNRP